MQPIRINDQLSVAAQPDLADFKALAARKAGLGHPHIPIGITEAWRGIGEA